MEMERILPAEAAKILNVSAVFVRVAMQQNRLPIGSAVKMSSKWSYQISKKLLEEYTGKDVTEELARIREEERLEQIKKKEEKV